MPTIRNPAPQHDTDLAWSIFLEAPDQPVELFDERFKHEPALFIHEGARAEFQNGGLRLHSSWGFRVHRVAIDRPDVHLTLRSYGGTRCLSGPWLAAGPELTTPIGVRPGAELRARIMLLRGASKGLVRVQMKLVLVDLS